jgi:mono/diheme cytochrome c family protein
LEAFQRSVAIACLAAMVLAVAATSSAVAQADGRQLYMDNCARCHGAQLEGQSDWMVRKPDGKLPAPPHDASGHTWHHSDAQLLTIVRDGLEAIAPGYETDMPAFGETLTEAQIHDILEYIKSSWPERERNFQAARQ